MNWVFIIAAGIVAPIALHHESKIKSEVIKDVISLLWSVAAWTAFAFMVQKGLNG